MSETRKIKRALVSVFHKDGLEDILRKLHAEGVELLSTGGTQAFIESLGIPCQKVEDVTTYPSILGGRVKTLHPKVFGGILGRRENEGDIAPAVPNTSGYSTAMKNDSSPPRDPPVTEVCSASV